MRQRRRGDDGRVGDFHAVVHFVALLQAAQNRDGVLHRRLVDQHLLEAPLERRILLDVLAVFIEGGGADAMQFAARQRRLQHVARIHGALRLAGAHHGVQFVDEQNHLAFLLGQIIEHRLQPLLEFAAEFRARDQCSQVERQDSFVAQALRHFAVDDALCQSFDDGGLAHAGLADQDGIVLGAPLQDLNGAADLVVAADHRVELPRGRALGQIDAVLLQRLAILLGARIVHFGAAAHLLDGLFDRSACGAVGLEQPSQLAAVVAGREHEQFAGNELIAALLRQLVGDVQQLVQVVAEQHFAAGTLDFRHPIQSPGEIRAQFGDLSARLLEQRPCGSALLFEQRRHEMHGLDVLIIAAHGERLGIGQCRLKLGRQLVHTHR